MSLMPKCLSSKVFKEIHVIVCDVMSHIKTCDHRNLCINYIPCIYRELKTYRDNTSSGNC